ncbi:hypothetical protein GQX74_013537, partial [Glossina fuscipes]
KCEVYPLHLARSFVFVKKVEIISGANLKACLVVRSTSSLLEYERGSAEWYHLAGLFGTGSSSIRMSSAFVQFNQMFFERPLSDVYDILIILRTHIKIFNRIV